MQIACESCGAVVPAESIDLQRNLAKCTACNHVFNCQGQLEAFLGIKDRRVSGEARG